MAPPLSSAHTQQIARASIKDYWLLTKPRLISLVVFTGFTGLLIAPGSVHPLLSFLSVLCIAMASGGSAAINMWYDRDIDALMKRTQSRSLPSGRTAPDDVLLFGILLNCLGVAMMGIFLNWTAAFLLAFGSFFYAVVYTMFLKRRTPQNIVIGGAAGAFPPMIGWVSITGTIDFWPMLLFALIFLWTPPHFWSLSLFTQEDYKKASIPMLPIVRGEKTTRRSIFVYSLLLAGYTFFSIFFPQAGWIYTFTAVISSVLMVFFSIRVLRKSSSYSNEKRLFFFSIAYIYLIFFALILDNIILRMVS